MLSEPEQAVFACALSAPELRARRNDLARDLFPSVSAVVELPDGYALEFPGERHRLLELAELVAFERECCPFLRFELDCAPESGPLLLRVRGPQAAKEFIAATFVPDAPG
ncbi:MAG: hypothetical protein DCC58_18250 [Chloroflexi bacterium]|nr:MAG: hypothetical protein DCC58_18250 [Chloroflexota bacterium]